MNHTLTKEFSRYLVVGGIAFIVDITSLALVHNILSFHYILATSIAFLLGTWTNYIISIHWVFKHRTLSNQHSEFGIFLLVGILTLSLSLLLMSELVGWLEVPVLIAKCITTGLTLVANFAGRRILLFTHLERTPSSPVSSAIQ
jgi:putative flippase GtrA